MVFSSNLFIFGFMPIFFAAYYLAPGWARNGLVLLASLSFYTFGAGPIVVILILSIIVNYLAARAIETSLGQSARLIFCLTVILNVVALFYYKYADFAWHVANNLSDGLLQRSGFVQPDVPLPIGISFFTFQALSYVADVYTKHCRSEPSIIRFGMYHSLFPQLIAGPIVRYVEIYDEIASREIRLQEISEGCTRFIIGLAKKVIIADHAGKIADRIFDLGTSQLTPAVAWLGAVAYGIQILFDFSGYSDMAIGLGRLIGFHFPENFADPYLSRNVTEFWRRWHMTLSRWFRDYVYIPLGGNRRGLFRTYLNLLIVFFLCGLWHGAGYTFVVWGLFHGTFLAAERILAHRWNITPQGICGQIYTLLAVTVGWVFFRSNDLTQSILFLKEMAFIDRHELRIRDAIAYLPRDLTCYLVAGIILAVIPMPKILTASTSNTGALILQRTVLLLLFVYSAATLSGSTFSPFIYFRF